MAASLAVQLELEREQRLKEREVADQHRPPASVLNFENASFNDTYVPALPVKLDGSEYKRNPPGSTSELLRSRSRFCDSKSSCCRPFPAEETQGA